MFTRTSLIALAFSAATASALTGCQLQDSPSVAAACPATLSFQCLENRRALPDFSLLRDDGTALTGQDLQGRWTIVFIGFTYCPDVCPTTLAELRQAQKQWQALPEASRPRLLFVSVDPERDTPERVGQYAHAFHADTLAATGTLPALERFARSLSLVFMKQAPTDPKRPEVYAVDHSAALAVIDPQLRFAGHIQPAADRHGFDAEKIARDFILLSQTQP
ncbi:hypothetical protein CO614_01600 [Lysobacteraceae bacterium NML120232]|nr:hypothetical protein CO608_01215 [Xanthomonadaceae bacterium NML08-0793]PJK13391.1 hypothetical protein CO614_01600 [Xanthomonadaceae bacterium NML120232]